MDSLPVLSVVAPVIVFGSIRSTDTVPPSIILSKLMVKSNPGISNVGLVMDIALSIAVGSVPGKINSPGDKISDAATLPQDASHETGDNNNPFGRTTFAGIG